MLGGDGASLFSDCRGTSGSRRRSLSAGMDVFSRWLGLAVALSLLCASLAGPVNRETNRQRKVHLLHRVLDDIREILELLQEEDDFAGDAAGFPGSYMSTSHHGVPAKREPPSGFAAVLGKRGGQEVPHRRYSPYGRNGYKRDPPSGFVSVLGKRDDPKYDYLIDGPGEVDRENLLLGEFSGDSGAAGKDSSRDAFWHALAKVGKRSAEKPSAHRSQS